MGSGIPRLCRFLCVSFLAIVPLAACEADATAISQIIQAQHIPHYTVLDPVFDSATGTRVVSYTRAGDSALWTGYYLAAEAFRYSVTHSPDALDNARRAVAGIQALVDVTGNNMLARCLIPEDSPYAAAIQSEEAGNGIYRSGPGNFWVGNTSRDQYSGVLFGLGVAYDLVDDQPLKASIASLVTRLVQFLKDHAWTVVLLNGTITTTFIGRPDQQLAFLQLARHVNPHQFSTAYDIQRIFLSAAVIAPISFEVLSDDSYFKFNLDTVNLYTLIRLESSSFGALYRKAYDILRNHTDDHGNAFFNMIDRAINGPNPARDAATAALLDQWLQRPRRDLYVDNRGQFPWCGNPDTACQPIPVQDRVTTDFLWQRSPFQLANLGGENNIEGAGIDYILPYWMARYYGLVPADGLRTGSAASGAAPLAPEEIASVFGLNLPVGAESSTQPPPVSLGGVSITVRDGAGVSRPAPVLYVSQAQVNFLVPAGTAPGIASVAIHSPGGADAVISVEIAEVAPALFTADGSGKGVVSATAVQITAGSQTAVPVSSCADAICSAVPIALGAESPVVLTLWGTGIRHGSSVSCTIGGVDAPVLYAGAQGEFAGLDQVNVALPPALRGIGETDLILTVDGRPSNAVRIFIQ